MNDLTYDAFAESYLLQLQALALEICRAMEAIAANALTNFRESVAKQEMLCGVLAGMVKSKQGSPVASDNPVERGIEDATEAIRQLNLQYAALLKHSGRSIALLVSLCRSHTGQFQEAHGPRLKRQTWSCEM